MCPQILDFNRELGLACAGVKSSGTYAPHPCPAQSKRSFLLFERPGCGATAGQVTCLRDIFLMRANLCVSMMLSSCTLMAMFMSSSIPSSKSSSNQHTKGSCLSAPWSRRCTSSGGPGGGAPPSTWSPACHCHLHGDKGGVVLPVAVDHKLGQHLILQ